MTDQSTKSAHTPGPWQIKNDNDPLDRRTIVANVDGDCREGVWHYTYEVIAICEDEYDDALPNFAANARLIAAAPDLLDALEKAAIRFEFIAIGSDVVRAEVGATEARAAIAKATGRPVRATDSEIKE